MAYTALSVTDSLGFGKGAADVGFEAVDQANGNSIPATGDIIVLIDNGSGGALTVTITAPSNVRTLAQGTTVTRSISNGNIGIMGPFDPSIFGQSTGAEAGKTLIDYSTGTSVTIAAVKQLPTPS